jgi:hypothetical protein
VVTVGSTDVRTAHLVEFGTKERGHKDGTPTGQVTAQPFILPAWRLVRARVERRLQRSVRAGIRAALAVQGASDVQP